MRFNRTPLVPGGRIEQPSMAEIRATQSLWQAPLEVAVKYGGPITRAAIAAASLGNDRRYCMVDSKIHMLMPGFYPAIPGWHTDGAPRGAGLDARKQGAPALFAQEFAEPPNLRLQEDHPANRYHALVTGEHCLTEFMFNAQDIEVPEELTPKLYGILDAKIEAEQIGSRGRVNGCQMVAFDWWHLHRAMPSSAHEWRYFIRITETDYWPPSTDLASILRTQQQVYLVGASFGW